MKLQHTPGPWVVSGLEIHDRETRFDDSGARTGNTPNSIAYLHLVPVGCREANGRLIAAAPELLEALERLLACVSPQSRQSTAISFSAPKLNAADQARAAILKAKGE